MTYVRKKSYLCIIKLRDMDILYIYNNNNGVCNISTDWKDWYAKYNEKMTPLKFEELKFKKRK